MSSVQSTFDTSVVDNVKKAFIFDIDGTLADSWKLGFDATRVVLKNNNIKDITVKTYHQCTKFATPDRLARHAGLMPGDETYKELGDKLADEFDSLYVGLVDQETANFYEGIKELLDDIPPDIAVGALTNACVAYAHAVLKTNGVADRFQSIRGADDVPKPKPAPDGLFTVCNDIGVLPENCIYVGDSPSDGAAAKAAGMRAIGVLWGSHPEESLKAAPFDTFCASVEELKSHLEGIANRVDPKIPK